MSVTGTKLSLFVPVKPLPKERPRFRVVKGRVFTYTPQKTADYEQIIAEQVQKASAGLRYTYEGPVRVDCLFKLLLPKSRQREAVYHGSGCPDAPPDSLILPAWDMKGGIYVQHKKCQAEAFAYYQPLYPMTSSDLDNKAKAVLDGIQKSGLIKNDKQVVAQFNKQVYALEEGVRIDIQLGGLI
jgi:Holliday junction resolvase RusA-like endonuclease